MNGLIDAIQTQVDPFYRGPIEVNEKKNRLYVFQFPLQMRAAEANWIPYSFYIGQTDPSRGWLVDGEFLVRWADGDYSKCPEKPKLLSWVDVHNDITDHEIRVLMRKYGWTPNKEGSPEMIIHPSLKDWTIGINQFIKEVEKLDNYYTEYEKKHGISPAEERKRAKNKEDDMFRIPPRSLIYDMCDNLKDLPKDAKIYVPQDAHGHFCDYLLSIGFENLYTDKDYEHFPKDIKASFVELEKVNLITEEEYNSMNFTATIGNPPFDGTLHLEFLKKCLDNSDYVCLVHPGGWLFRSTSKIEKEVRYALKNRVKKLELLNGNAKFPGARFGCPLVVTTAYKKHTGPIELVYGTTGNSYYIDSLDDMPSGFWEPSSIHLETVAKFKELTLTTSIYNLLKKYTGVGSALSTPRTCGHANFLSTPRVCGNQTRKVEDFVSYDFYTFFYRNSKILEIDKNNKVYVTSSEKERDSLISYMKTKVARFGLSINKISQDVHISRYLENVPLPPLDREWTEESIMDYYEFTAEQKELIDSFIPDYYV